MNSRYELVVFDWDGTLMDSELRIVTCMQRAAGDVGLVVSQFENPAELGRIVRDEAGNVREIVEYRGFHRCGVEPSGELFGPR